MNSDWFSAQYAENSTSDCVERIKAGAVSEARSPLNEAIDCARSVSFCYTLFTCRLTFKNEDHDPLLVLGTAPPSTSGMIFRLGGRRSTAGRSEVDVYE
jgi:hypothetical protein